MVSILYTFDVRASSTFDTSSFEVNHVGSTLVTPMDICDDTAMEEIFGKYLDNDATVEIEIDGEIYVYGHSDLYKFIMYYELERISPNDAIENVIAIESPVENAGTKKTNDALDDGCAEFSNYRFPKESLVPIREGQLYITTVYGGDESAATFVNVDCVYMGNEWDYYDGCVGTVFGNVDVRDIWVSGVAELSEAIAQRYEENGMRVEKQVIELTSDQFESAFLVNTEWLFK